MLILGAFLVIRSQAVEEGLIDAIGNLGDALRYLYAEIDAGKTGY